MTTNISCRNFELSDAIRAYVEEKTSHLLRINEGIMHIDVECDKNMHHNKGEVFHVRFNVQLPGELLHAEAQELELYAAVDVCKDETMEQLRKLKERRDGRRRQSRNTRRSLKSILTFWKSE
jgi:putative sigma-54 modulation protein